MKWTHLSIMQTLAKKQMKSSIRETHDNFTKAREGMCSKITQRSFKSGLSYKYKITTKRGNYGTTPIWNPSWCFWNSSDSLTKRTKLRFGKQEGMKMFHLSVQVRHNIKPHPNISWRTWKGQEPIHGTAQQATTLTEKLTHDLNRSSRAACSHVGTD